MALRGDMEYQKHIVYLQIYGLPIHCTFSQQADCIDSKRQTLDFLQVQSLIDYAKRTMRVRQGFKAVLGHCRSFK